MTVSSEFAAEDLAAFRRILDNFNAAWEKGDADQWVAYLDSSCDFMQAFGRYRPDRGSTRDFLAGFLALQSGGIRVREVGVRINGLGPGLALVEQTIEALGVQNTDGSRQPPRLGHMMLIVAQRDGDWRVIRYRFCDLHREALRAEALPTPEPVPRPAGNGTHATFRDGHGAPVTGLAVSTDERWLLSRDETGRYVLWDLTDLFGRQPLGEWPSMDGPNVVSAAWRATGHSDGSIEISAR